MHIIGTLSVAPGVIQRSPPELAGLDRWKDLKPVEDRGVRVRSVEGFKRSTVADTV
ncbi:hypothetical protein DSO57_1012275 [Entomophthora muscae]|uniref:Uncharacterized protein n=1 Tax=Entomophthora muscae TaxID=34485 RepID=A0ACC2TUL3_9FUNG|nr:hypothetical protein DSO57_1012275 [Entomophthora muscae]